MNLISVRLPKKLSTLRSVETMWQGRSDLTEVTDVEVNPVWTEFAEPLPLIYLAARIRGLQKKYPHVRWKLRLPSRVSRGFIGYASYIGLFRLLGFDFGQDVGYAAQSRGLIPIEDWPIGELWSDGERASIGERIDDKAAGITGVLLQRHSGEVFDIVQFAMREIARNAVEHSRGGSMLMLGQYWPARQCAEIVIADDGVGIAENLYDNEYVDISNNLAALKFSLLPGVTGVPLSTRALQDGKWANSGFGLYMVSRIGAKFGDFHLLSNNDYIRLRSGQQYHNSYPFKGTLVCVRLHLGSLSDTKSFLDKTISEGERMQSEILREYPIRASAASKMLRSQFANKLEGRI